MKQIRHYTVIIMIATLIGSVASIVSGQGTWAVLNGGSESETPYSMRLTSDSGYVQCGVTNSFGLINNDCWIIKLDSTGAMVWQKAFGGTDYDIMSGIWQTSDGGDIAAGGTWSFGAGNSDYWLVKLDGNGAIAWQRVYGGINYDFAHYVQQTSDGGYFVFGRSWSFGAGNGDLWLLKLDATGVIQWQRAYGGMNVETGYSAQQTLDGGDIVVGGTGSFGAGNSDVVVLKLDTNGTISWQKTYGGTNFDYAYSVIQTVDGGYIVAAATQSFGAGSMDCWVLKLDATGNVTWQKTYGG